MTTEITIALIAAGPPTLAAILAFLSSRSVKRSVGRTNGIPLSHSIMMLDQKVERLTRDLTRLTERQGRLEERFLWHLRQGVS